MNTKEKLDFNCPQYVDFLAGIDSNSNDIFFDCSDNFSPTDGNFCRNLPAPVQPLTEEAENKLVNKVTAALSFLENTPQLKTNVPRGKLFTEKAPVKNVCVQLVKPFMKSAAPSVRMRSKSVYEGNKYNADKSVKAREFRPKRSSSLNDLRSFKKHTYPKTPLCLKRTINANKHKVLKTTEELELEQIAVLQKQLTQLLRNNEISYKKMKERQKPCAQKKLENRPEIPKGNAAGIKTDNNTRQNFHALSRAAMRKTTLKLNSIINKESINKVPRNIYKDGSEKNPSVSSSIISEDCDKSRDQAPKKNFNAKYGLHSGLVFIDSIKKNRAASPFKFESRIKEMKPEIVGCVKKNEVSLTRSASQDDVNIGKENISVTKPKSVVSTFGSIQKRKVDVKLWELNKKVLGQSGGNLTRGWPLSENRVRK